MNYTLKSIKCYPSMSEETNCFEADLWLGNKKVAHIKNNGQGGCDSVHTYPNMKPSLDAIEAYIKTLPEIKLTDDPNDSRSFENDLEMEVARMINEFNNKKIFKKGILFNDDKGVERLITWNGTTLTKLLLIPNGIMVIKKAIKGIKERGGTIKNDNIDFLL